MLPTPLRAAATLALALVPAVAGAQNVTARPTYGTLTLSAGFTPDPQVLAVSAGGPDQVTIAGCTAYITGRAPDVDVTYASGSYALTIYATSGDDVTLLVNTPDGNWHCNDDADGTDPALTFDSPQSGRYNVWVGTYADPSGALPAARVFFTEGTPAWGGSAGAEPDWRADPTYGTIDLAAGFDPDPYVRSISAGGSDEVTLSGPGCSGYIQASAPDLDLNYTAGSYPLNLYVKSAEDVTLIVNLPDGSWACSDDANGTNPAILLSDPDSGNYNIWIGTFGPSSSPLPESILYLSEVAPRW